MNKNKKLNLKNDIIFKAFFSRKGNEEYLIDFLNALLGIEIESIEIKEEVNLEQLSVLEKGGRIDLQAKLNDGIIANIEMQKKHQKGFEIRTVFYASKVISREVERGTNYQDIKKTIMISILGNNMFKKYDEYISKTAIVLDKHREYVVMDNIEWLFIELPKFRKHHPDMNEKINQWIAFLDDEDKELVKMAEQKNETLKKARKEVDYLTGDAAIRRLAELQEDWNFDYDLGISLARKEGEQIGEKKAKIETAKKLMKMGIPIEQTIEATELTKEEIEKINL